MFAKKDRYAEYDAFVRSSASNVVPRPLFGVALYLQVMLGGFDCIFDALMRQLGSHDVWDIAAAVYLSSRVEPFFAEASVEVL